MKFLTRILLPAILAGLTLGFASASRAEEARKPNITILATGGTIAGAAATGTQSDDMTILAMAIDERRAKRKTTTLPGVGELTGTAAAVGTEPDDDTRV